MAGFSAGEPPQARASSLCPAAVIQLVSPFRQSIRTSQLPELEALDLASCRLRKLVHELDPARIFPFADLVFHVLLQRLGNSFADRALFENHERFRFLKAIRIAGWNDGGFKHLGMRDERL